MQWRYYKFMIQCVGDPRNNKVLSPKEKTELFTKYRNALLLRYTTHLDDTDAKDWYFCLKDTSYDFDSLKSKRKNVIRKGIRNFTVRPIKASNYVEELYDLINDAYQGYDNPTTVTYAQIEKKAAAIDQRDDYFVLGAFCNVDETLAGYVWCHVIDNWITISEQKTRRCYESKGVNAALLHTLCTLYNDNYAGCVLCDGERNVLHNTAFQDYLIKYFGFRYAYCNLHVVLNPTYAFFIHSALFLLPLYGRLLEIVMPTIYNRISAIKALIKLSGR